ncbi:MAG: hypothetical protein HYU64_10035, partial [Armatimonadetes bacterium]|nr:hypothetical protein [Armatimonadota bacterium]
MNIAALRYTPIARETKGGLPVEGSSVHPNMVEKLLSGGLGENQIIKDAEYLRKENAGQTLLDKGFKREGDHQGRRV